LKSKENKKKLLRKR